jgi:hypothetical protein
MFHRLSTCEIGKTTYCPHNIRNVGKLKNRPRQSRKWILEVEILMARKLLAIRVMVPQFIIST